jgi:hypothetical protein
MLECRQKFCEELRDGNTKGRELPTVHDSRAGCAVTL